MRCTGLLENNIKVFPVLASGNWTVDSAKAFLGQEHCCQTSVFHSPPILAVPASNFQSFATKISLQGQTDEDVKFCDDMLGKA